MPPAQGAGSLRQGRGRQLLGLALVVVFVGVCKRMAWSHTQQELQLRSRQLGAWSATRATFANHSHAPVHCGSAGARVEIDVFECAASRLLARGRSSGATIACPHQRAAQEREPVVVRTAGGALCLNVTTPWPAARDCMHPACAPLSILAAVFVPGFATGDAQGSQVSLVAGIEAPSTSRNAPLYPAPSALAPANWTYTMLQLPVSMSGPGVVLIQVGAGNATANKTSWSQHAVRVQHTWSDRASVVASYSPTCSLAYEPDTTHTTLRSIYLDLGKYTDSRYYHGQAAPSLPPPPLHDEPTWLRSVDHRYAQHPTAKQYADFTSTWTKVTDAARAAKVAARHRSVEVYYPRLGKTDYWFADKGPQCRRQGAVGNSYLAPDADIVPGNSRGRANQPHRSTSSERHKDRKDPNQNSTKHDNDGTHSIKTPMAEPISIHILALESTSRPMVMRYLPKTVQALRGLGQDAAPVFDGFHTQAPGSTSAQMIPMLTNTTYDYNKWEESRTGYSDCDRSFAQGVDSAKAVWNVLKGRGYTTGMAVPCGNQLMGVKKCSWNSEFDHSLPLMGCKPNDGSDGDSSWWECEGCQEVTHRQTEDQVTKGWQNGYIAGHRNAYPNARGKALHDLAFEWSDALWCSSKPKFVYTHLDGPHGAGDGEGSILGAYDAALVAHIKQMRQRHRSVLVLMGDHGPPSGTLQRVPFLSMVLSEDLQASSSWAPFGRALATNTHRLVSHKDLYATILHLSDLAAAEHQQNVRLGHPQSLLLEVPADRTCAEADIDDLHCACAEAVSPWQTIQDHRLQQEAANHTHEPRHGHPQARVTPDGGRGSRQPPPPPPPRSKCPATRTQCQNYNARTSSKLPPDGMVAQVVARLIGHINFQNAPPSAAKDASDWPCAHLHLREVGSASKWRPLGNSGMFEFDMAVTMLEGHAPKPKSSQEHPTEFRFTATVFSNCHAARADYDLDAVPLAPGQQKRHPCTRERPRWILIAVDVVIVIAVAALATLLTLSMEQTGDSDTSRTSHATCNPIHQVNSCSSIGRMAPSTGGWPWQAQHTRVALRCVVLVLAILAAHGAVRTMNGTFATYIQDQTLVSFDTLMQVTRYKKHEVCTPANVSPLTCVCAL